MSALTRHNNDNILKDAKRLILNFKSAYVYGDWQRDKITEWARNNGITLQFSRNLEREATSTPYYSVRLKGGIE